ncbi:MAG: GNAT family N-acetyltransferase [Nocardioidaceae bacterium]|nr:GNAT family N-acetyltransferase [Nocardioidaceae bacterium]MCB8993280.1 GNAT family N-acetyltransferase [Nocardioidaceae bacterium]MCO5324556.1 GNAT family N-acetyltransferase [Nocardioidaceae bacterium]HMU35206.1 GNAT family N-acetyltransferase [Marmoricola sp.]
MQAHDHSASPAPSGGADVSVRVGWSDDAPAIAEIQVSAWRATYAEVLPGELLDQLDAGEIAEVWAQSLTQSTDARNRVLVGLERNTVRGFCVTGPCPDPDADPIRVGEISDLTVDPEHLGNGHGSRLMQAAVDTLVADHFEIANVWVNSEADALRKFLESAGWAPDGAHRTLELISGDAQVKQVRLHTTIAG